MNWSDIPFQPSKKSLRQFAAGCLVIITGLGAYHYFAHHRHALGAGLMTAGIALGAAGLIKPRLLRPIFVGWMVLAFPIGWTVSLCVLSLMFYGILTPVAFFLRLRGRDVLHRRKPAPGESLWTPVEPVKNAASYFRQF